MSVYDVSSEWGLLLAIEVNSLTDQINRLKHPWDCP